MKDYKWVINCPLKTTPLHSGSHDWMGDRHKHHEMMSDEGITFHLINLRCKCGAAIVIMKPDVDHYKPPEHYQLGLHSIRDGDLIQ